MIQAYRIKMFFDRFSIKTFVLNPELPKNQIRSLIHYFHVGHFDILILLHTGYSHRPQIKTVMNVINFDPPAKYNNYKENGQQIEFENGAELTFI